MAPVYGDSGKGAHGTFAKRPLAPGSCWFQKGKANHATKCLSADECVHYRESTMSKELWWLALTLAMTALFAFPYVLNRIAVRGLMGAMANPSPDDRPVPAWARRAQCAHANAVENLVVFAPAVLAVQVANRGDSLTAAACGLYFVSRLLHYVVYTAGVPVVRTLSFFGGWAGIAILIARLLGWL